MARLIQDLKFSLRIFIRYPTLAFITTAALALGIGLTTLIFSVVNAVLLEPLPFDEPDRIATLWQVSLPSKDQKLVQVSYPNFQDWRQNSSRFEDMAAIQFGYFNLTGNDQPERIPGSLVSASMFPAFAVKPMIGRWFLAEEDQPGASPVAIIGYNLWQRSYAGDTDLGTKRITVDGTIRTVVGVMPPKFQYPGRSEIWIPLTQVENSARRDRNNGYLIVIGRLKPETRLDEAQAEMDVLADQINRNYYLNADTKWGIAVVALSDFVTRDIRPALVFLQVGALFVLLIACGNVATILLAHTMNRRKEIAIRIAVGAKRHHVIQQLFTQGLLSGIMATGIGLLICFWGDSFLLTLNTRIPRLSELGVNLRVLGFITLTCLLTTIIFSAAPALQSLRTNTTDSLKENSHSVAGQSRTDQLFNIFVVAQIALTLMLLVGAGSVIAAFVRLQQVTTGFNPENVLSLQITLPASAYADPKVKVNFIKQVVERVEAIPGVEHAGIVSYLPLTGANLSRSVESEGKSASTDYRVVSPHYFRTMGIALLEGREFSEFDDVDGTKVAIINQRLSKWLFSDENPLGKGIRIGIDSAPVQVVGVIGNVRHRGLDKEMDPEIYVPYDQAPVGSMALALRVDSDPARITPAVRSAILSLDKNQPVSDVQTMQQRISSSISQQRLQALLLAAFGVVALVLATSGVYAVASYSVSRRTHEIGVRIALGAQPRDIYNLILSKGGALIALGLAIGTAAALASTKILANVLLNFGGVDAAAYVGIASLLGGVALVACYIPARRATKISPLVAIRDR